MPHVHRLRHVGTAVVDDHLEPGFRNGNADPIIVLHHLRVPREVFVGDNDVDESGSGDVQRRKRRSITEVVDHCLRQLARILADRLRSSEGTIALVLRKLRALRWDDQTGRPVHPRSGERVAEDSGEI